MNFFQPVLYFMGLVLATLLWGTIFYKKDYHPQPLAVVFQIFWIGLLAVFPIFGYQFVFEHYLPFLSSYKILQPILSDAFLAGLFYFIFYVTLLALLLFLLSFLLTAAVTLFSHSTLQNSRLALKDEPLNFIAVSMIIGFTLLAESVLRQWIHIPIPTSALGSIVFLVIIEEYVKHLVVRLVDDKKLKQIDDAITLSIIVGLAFAFVETLLYAFMASDLNLIVYRILLSMPVHLVASGIFGYYYGLAHFAQPITAQMGGKHRILQCLHRALFLKKVTLYREEKMLEGLLLATLFHTACNILFELDLAFIVVPVVVLGLWIIFGLYDQKVSRKIWGPATTT